MPDVRWVSDVSEVGGNAQKDCQRLKYIVEEVVRGNCWKADGKK